ncbi:MAG: hypothetical protein ACERKN_05170 [Velocimicrobium sp.]
MEEDKRLKQALDKQISREIERIPSEEEIKKSHTYSDAFLIYMQQLICKEKRKNEKRKHTRPGHFLKIAACFICFIGIGTLMFTIPQLGRMGSSDKNAQVEMNTGTGETTEDAIDDYGIHSFTADQSSARTKSEESEEGMGMENNFFVLVSTSFDGEYHIEVRVKNTTDTDMTYTPIYDWKYTLDGKTSQFSLDMDIKKSQTVLKAGESIIETYDLDSYGVKKAGGELELTRMINKEESTLDVMIEE